MRCIYLIILFVFIAAAGRAQNDTASQVAHRVILLPDTTKPGTIKRVVQPDSIANAPVAADTSSKYKHDPHKATLRSLIIPGWGQAYNREYWKIPLVYAAIGIPVGTYFYNNTWYKRTRDAYTIVVNKDTASFGKINKKLFYQGYPLDAASLQSYRNQFRRDRDYSLLITLFAWALNVVDATVFGHLKDFDVSDDLSMRVHPSYDANTKVSNLGLVFNFKDKPHKVATFTP